MLFAEVTAPFDASLNTVVPLYLKSKSVPSSTISHLLVQVTVVAHQYRASKSPPNCGELSFDKSATVANERFPLPSVS